MAVFVIEQYELHVSTYKIEAENEEVAKQRIMDEGIGELDLLNQEYISPAIEHGSQFRNAHIFYSD